MVPLFSGEKDDKGDFQGNFFKDFYQQQGDYSEAERIEEEEKKHAKEIKEKE